MADQKVAVKADAPPAPVVQFGELTARVAATFAIEPTELWKALKAEFFPGGAASDAQMFMVLQIMDKYKLNPFMREMFAAVSQKTGKLLVGVQYDGYMTIAHRHPNYKGFQFEYEKDKDGKVTAIICKVYRSDWEHPGEYRAEMAEWRLRGKDTWDQRPTHQLGVKAFNNAVRLTLGLSGIYDPDDIERIQASEQKAIETTAKVIDDKASVESSPAGDAAADTQATSPTAPAAAPIPLAERRKRKKAEVEALPKEGEQCSTLESTKSEVASTDAEPAQSSGSKTEATGTSGFQAASGSLSDGASKSDSVGDSSPREHLDKLIARHVPAARLNLLLGKMGVVKVEQLTDEQVAELTATIERRIK